MLIRCLLLIQFLVTLMPAVEAQEVHYFSYNREFEIQLCPDPASLAKPIQGDPVKAVALATDLFRLAGPKLGSRFIESCYLLCLADLRPYSFGNGYIIDPQPGDDEVYDQINRFLVPRGYSIHPKKMDEQGRVNSFSLHSLAGLEKRTHSTHLAWVPPYNRSSGWKGYYEWKKEIWKHMPDHSQPNYDRVEGFLLGYPDGPIEHWGQITKAPSLQVMARVAEADYFSCDLPLFAMLPQDSSDPAVEKVEKEWGRFLTQAYESRECASLEVNPEFHAARLQYLQAYYHDAPTPEGRRLGLTLARGDGPLNSYHERWLQVNLEVAVAALKGHADLVLAAQNCPTSWLRASHLWAWIWSGSLGGNPARHRLFETFRAHHPDTLRQLYLRNLHNCPLVEFSRALDSKYGQAIFSGLSQSEQESLLKRKDEIKKTAP